MAPLTPRDTSDNIVIKPFKVLVTSFGAFRDYSENPSHLATKDLDGTTLESPPEPINLPPGVSAPSDPPTHDSPTSPPTPIHIKAVNLPVTYKAVLDALEDIYSPTSERYDLILHVGVGLPGGLKLEQRARRWGYNNNDAKGELAPMGKEGLRGYPGEKWDGLASSGPDGEEIRTVVQADKVIEFGRRNGVERLAKSEDAGVYLCEFIFFGSLASTKRVSQDAEEPETPVQFLHVPRIGQPYSLAELTKAIKLILWGIVNEGGLLSSAR
ncbi:peptidase C15, pyroglutamyl peptidase I-like protein [Meredithblackwellia eburnea MCA 4105]